MDDLDCNRDFGAESFLKSRMRFCENRGVGENGNNSERKGKADG